ncbi:MAG: 3-hydroxyacyl-CoA dehydrogenase NAD-binding domain-containing protein [Planctomycetota bacterium]
MIDYSVSDGVCLLRLNTPPLNTITFELLDELRECVRRANADAAVQGIIITGAPGHFSAGADINLFKQIKSADDAIRTSRLFQEAFQEVEDSAKPVVAAVGGRVMGSALELPMACHFRACEKSATFSMPEVTLGINPGAGGTQRLPRLIGVGPALDMLLTGKPIDAEAALDLGLMDAVCERDELLSAAKNMLRSGGAAIRTRDRIVKVSDPDFRRAEEMVEKGRREIIAPRKILEAVRIGLTESFDAGLRKEQDVFAECMNTPATQNKIYLFFATRETGKAPELASTKPRDIRRAAVIGMGSMGTGIAQAIVMGGVPVVVRDEEGTALERGMDRIRDSFRRAVEQKKITAEQRDAALALISTTTNWRGVADADLVIEAVFEDVKAKRSVIALIEKVCREDTIIASNTSTISLDILAEGMRRPGRLIGLHFFNPAHRMPLVEAIRRKETRDNVIATALAFAKTIRKTPVLVRNREGFLVNRMFVPYLKEAFWLLEEGTPAGGIDRAMVDFGFAMGPLALIDMAGIDILVHTDRVLTEAFPSHGPLSQIVTRLVEEDHLGQKTESGVYKYEKGDYTPYRSAITDRIVAEAQKASARTPREVGPEEITDRLILRMVNEAFYILKEGIVRRESDLDAATVLGIGFPDFRGGVLKYARDLGLDTVLKKLDALAGQLGERFSPCELLREMKGV